MSEFSIVIKDKNDGTDAVSVEIKAIDGSEFNEFASLAQTSPEMLTGAEKVMLCAWAAILDTQKN